MMATRRIQSASAAMVVALSLAAPVAATAADAMRVVRDPQTGELRGPTAAEAEAFRKAEEQLRAARNGNQAATAAAVAAPQEITYPDGTVEMPLGDDTMLSAVATLGADGSLKMLCLPAQRAQSVHKAAKNSSFSKSSAAKSPMSRTAIVKAAP